MYKVWAASGFYSTMSDVISEAKRAEAMGYDCFSVIDSVHDGLMASALAAQATEKIEIATSALACFPRSPMTTAVAAWDLQEYSGGRFKLGLGPLIKPIITQKYSTEWYPPAPRMREYVQAVRAIFDCWQNDVPLNFRGEYYKVTRQQEYSKPPKLENPDIPIHLAAIGPNMTALAGELASGVIPHPTNSCPRYIKEVMRKNVAKGAARTGRSVDDIEFYANSLCATGTSAEIITAQREQHRKTLATVFSTPNYWPSLELYGWQDKGEHLKYLVSQGKWDEMPSILTDEMLDTFVPSGHYEEIANIFKEQYGDLVDIVCFTMPEDPTEDAAVAKVIAQLQDR